MTTRELLAKLVREAWQGLLDYEDVLEVIPLLRSDDTPLRELYEVILDDVLASVPEASEGGPNCTDDQLTRLAVDAAILGFHDVSTAELLEYRKNVLRKIRHRVPTIEEAAAEIENCISGSSGAF